MLHSWRVDQAGLELRLVLKADREQEKISLDQSNSRHATNPMILVFSAELKLLNKAVQSNRKPIMLFLEAEVVTIRLKMRKTPAELAIYRKEL